jgi:release factor glutamine methyltransferase
LENARKKLDKIWKIIDIIDWGKEFFAGKGIESSRLNIELILCKVLNIDRIKLYTSYDLPLQPNELAQIRDMVKRRAKREPLQYILGSTSFMGLEILVDENVLVPRPETEELVELVINNHRNDKNIRILDIGTGSGCIAIALSHFLSDAEVLGIDVSESALNLASRNSEMNLSKKISFEKKDFLKNCNFLGTYNVLVSNPPYISKKEYEGSDEKEIFFEPRKALTDEEDGLVFYRKFAGTFRNLLCEGGRFYLELGYNQSVEVAELFENDYDIVVHKDFAGIERIIEGSVKIL